MDWSKAPADVVLRIVEEGEAYLDGQLKLATSADQRAAVLAGVFTAAGTALLAGLIAMHAAGAYGSLPQQWPIYAGGATAAIFFLVAASYCVGAIYPVGFWLPGNEPESWYRDVETGKSLTTALAEEAEHIQSKIVENRQIVGRNAKRFKIGATLGIAAPITGILVWLVSSSSLWVSM